MVVSYRNSTSNHNFSFAWPASWCCILSKFYIKPQRYSPVINSTPRCILSKFYIKPQLARQWLLVPCGCILSKFYIKPQLPAMAGDLLKVVSYRNSTSNHNLPFCQLVRPIVVSYRNSTSNHNISSTHSAGLKLYLIEILHQTTTSGLILIDKVLLTGCLPL